VIDLIRGQKAQDALQSLRYMPKRAASTSKGVQRHRQRRAQSR
jgi:ribosomal protein L22